MNKLVMTVTIAACAILIPTAYGEQIPEWIKTNAKWWSEDKITDVDFVLGIQYLIHKNVIQVPTTSVAAEQSNKIPEWIKNNAGWWGNGQIDDVDFVSGIQYLIINGIISIQSKPQDDSQNTINSVDDNAKCNQLDTPAEKRACQKEIEMQKKISDIKSLSKIYDVGPVKFYYPGSAIELSSSGMAILNLQLLVENTADKNVELYCSGPTACNYDITNGEKTFLYSTNDFTSGKVVIKPGQSKIVNFLFGPAIGYGSSVDFEYDSVKQYFFRVKEPFGKTEILLDPKIVKE